MINQVQDQAQAQAQMKIAKMKVIRRVGTRKMVLIMKVDQKMKVVVIKTQMKKIVMMDLIREVMRMMIIVTVIAIIVRKRRKRRGWHRMLQGTLQSNGLITAFPNTIRLFFIHLYIECQFFADNIR